MLRVLLAALGATFGWWLGILAGSMLGGAVAWFASPMAGRLVGGLCAGLIGGAIESGSTVSMRGKRLRFTGATALVTALLTLLLLEVQVLPWLIGGVVGAALAVAQAKALGLARRDAILRLLTSAATWSLGFFVLQTGGPYGKIGVIAPGLAAVLLALASSSRVRGWTTRSATSSFA